MKELATALAAAQVLAFRLPMLWAMTLSPTPARRAEAVKMIVEKQAAAAEGINAAAFAAFTQWMEMLAGRTSAGTAMTRLADAAARPARRRIKANARRLRRRKRL
ncbi:MAG: hypothetical protein AB7S92_02985 [Parvibaculaceae bacterium]